MAEFKTEIEIPEILEKQRKLIVVLGAKASAFDACYKAFKEIWGEYMQEGDKIVSDFASGKGASKELALEILTKVKCFREVVCFMEETFKKCEEGGGEC